MIKRCDNKGFTLVELLAVIVILSAIMGIALPSITSSLERSKNKQNQAKYESLESFAELYVTDYKMKVYNNLNANGQCYIEVSVLASMGYLPDDALEDADGNVISGRVWFNRGTNSYKFNKGTSAPSGYSTSNSCTV